MTHFIGEMSHNQNHSHDPAWLPLVTKYLSDFLRGKYVKTGLGQSAKIVVTIMRRFLARGIVYGITVWYFVLIGKKSRSLETFSLKYPLN